MDYIIAYCLHNSNNSQIHQLFLSSDTLLPNIFLFEVHLKF